MQLHTLTQTLQCNAAWMHAYSLGSCADGFSLVCWWGLLLLVCMYASMHVCEMMVLAMMVIMGLVMVVMVVMVMLMMMNDDDDDDDDDDDGVGFVFWVGLIFVCVYIIIGLWVGLMFVYVYLLA